MAYGLKASSYNPLTCKDCSVVQRLFKLQCNFTILFYDFKKRFACPIELGLGLWLGLGLELGLGSVSVVE